MGAFDQVVVSCELHIVCHGLVVTEEIDGVQVTVEEMPRAIVEDLGDAVSENPRRRRSESRLLPQGSETDGIVAAGVVTIDVEYLDRVPEFIVIPARVVAVLELLEPERKRLFGVRHVGGYRRLHYLRHVSEVVYAIRQPRVHHVGIAHVLHPHRPVRLPGLEERPLRVHPHSHRRAAVAAVHRPALNHGILLCPPGALLDVGLRHVRRVGVHPPGENELRRSRLCLRGNPFRAGTGRCRGGLILRRSGQRPILSNHRRDAYLIQQSVEVGGRRLPGMSAQPQHVQPATEDPVGDTCRGLHNVQPSVQVDAHLLLPLVPGNRHVRPPVQGHGPVPGHVSPGPIEPE